MYLSLISVSGTRSHFLDLCHDGWREADRWRDSDSTVSSEVAPVTTGKANVVYCCLSLGTKKLTCHMWRLVEGPSVRKTPSPRRIASFSGGIAHEKRTVRVKATTKNWRGICFELFDCFWLSLFNLFLIFAIATRTSFSDSRTVSQPPGNCRFAKVYFCVEVSWLNCQRSQ